MRQISLTILTFFIFMNVTTATNYLDVEYRRYMNKNWLEIMGSEQQNIELLLQIIKESSTGKKLIQKALSKAARNSMSLGEAIIPGNGSLTDTTLIRKFSPHSPDKVIYESKSIVYINRYHTLKDAVLDLAHELTHFVYREPFNPYRTDFSFREFLVSTVEGRGGEVDAYLVECQVLKDVIGASHVANSDCSRVQNEVGKFSKPIAVKEFYKVGNYAERYWDKLKKYDISQETLPWLTRAQAHFISSAYGLPYPLAAYEEYMNIMTKVCENDSKRLSLMSSSASRNPDHMRSRSLASLKNSYNQRCSNLNP